MATYFIKGAKYSNSATNYGLRPRDQTLDAEADSMPTLNLICTGVTKTHVVFKFCQPAGSGATYNPGWLLGQTKRCRIRRDANGLYAAPLGRFEGMPIVRP